MGDKSAIEWTDATWNPIVGCTVVSAGCDHCYAATLHNRRYLAWKRGTWDKAPTQYHQPFKQVQLMPDRLTQPLKWKQPRRIFVNSLSDLFHEDVPDEYIDKVFAIMSICPQHTFQVLTKRPERMKAYFDERWQLPNGGFDCRQDRIADQAFDFSDGTNDQHWMPDGGIRAIATWPLPNVWLGVSVENQAAADERIPLLLQTPAAVRFLSCEPLLGPVNIGPELRTERCHCGKSGMSYDYCDGTQCRLEPAPRIDWVIVGGESGKHARPIHPKWATDLRDQCQAAGVPYFFKQWGEYRPTAIFDAPNFSSGRAFDSAKGGRVAATIRYRSVKAFTPGVSRPLRPGDVNGYGIVLDDNTIAERLGKKLSGRELDGRTWDEMPAVAR